VRTQKQRARFAFRALRRCRLSARGKVCNRATVERNLGRAEQQQQQQQQQSLFRAQKTFTVKINTCNVKK